MKRFYFIFVNAEGVVKIDTTMATKYQDAISELETNGIKVLFLSTYYGITSRYLYKFFSLWVELFHTEIIDKINDSMEWKITSPYLYFDQRKQEFSVSAEMIFNDTTKQFVGYVPSKLIQGILIKNDF